MRYPYKNKKKKQDNRKELNQPTTQQA